MSADVDAARRALYRHDGRDGFGDAITAFEAVIRAESVAKVAALREAARRVLSYPGPVNMTEDAHSTCTPDECYVAALRAALATEGSER